ncbi:lipoyl protein ligase domain-containing protein [Croceicoccus sediminis]|uniref:lipoyl protein ligase domain-containing protein n=1 Tax=Croceicoccus sediminis TaxID=2571150 RepID=UPI0011843211|nr:hypothetical protein [Croceicoccus sediminis]
MDAQDQTRCDALFHALGTKLLGIAPDAIIHDALAEPQAAVDEDIVMAQQALGESAPLKLVRLWRNRPCLVLPRRHAHSPAIGEASALAGMPVVFRKSGGRCVAHGPHIANLTLILTGDHTAPRAPYRPLLDLLGSLFASMGFVGEMRSVSGAHCDGRHNFAVDGKKLAGTAALVMRRGERQAVLAHASISLHFIASDLTAIMQVERALGFEADYSAQSHVGLTELLGNAALSEIGTDRETCLA